MSHVEIPNSTCILCAVWEVHVAYLVMNYNEVKRRTTSDVDVSTEPSAEFAPGVDYAHCLWGGR